MFTTTDYIIAALNDDVRHLNDTLARAKKAGLDVKLSIEHDRVKVATLGMVENA